MSGAGVPFHAGLTPERVIDAALELTHGSHLHGWSIRDLARELGVAPSVLYHHVGGKELLARGVVERVVAQMPVPDIGLDWRDWFRKLLLPGRGVVASYPGVAKWLLMHGPVFAAALPILEAGHAVLQRAGFGDRVSLAYGLLLNTAMLTISVTDDRRLHEDDGPRDHATMMKEMSVNVANSPAARQMIAMLGPFTRTADEAEQHRAEYYRLAVEATIAGVASELLAHPAS